MKRTLLNNVCAYLPAPIPAKTGAGAGDLTTGAVIDRQGFLSAVLGLAIGDITGAPAKASLTLKILTGDEPGDADLAPLEDERAVFLPKAAAKLEANKSYSIGIDLLGCKRYIKLVPSLAFAGGTTPKLDIAGSALTLGDADQQPV